MSWTWLLACATSGPTDSTGPGETDVPSAFTGTDPALSPTANANVFYVSWSTSAAADSTLACGESGTLDHVLVGDDSADGKSHQVLVIGLAAGIPWQCAATSTTPTGDAWTSDTLEIDPPSEPSYFPTVYLDEASDTSAAGFVLVPTAEGGGGYGPSVALYDHQGRRVWWAAGELDELYCEAWLGLDGRSVWWLNMGATPSLHHATFDGYTNDEVEVPGLNHDFILLADGTLAVLEYDEREVDGYTVKGDRVVHLDADGTELGVLWSTWDAFDFDPDDGTYDPVSEEWTHANGLRYDPVRDEYVVTLRNFSSIVGVSAATGALDWVFGGVHSTFDLSAIDAEDQPTWPHGGGPSPDGLFLFNNRGQDPDAGLWSEGVAYTLDFDAMTATTAWTYDADQSVLSLAMGNVEDVGDGRRLVGFGVAGAIVELDGDDVTWRLDAALGTANGYVHVLPAVAGTTW